MLVVASNPGIPGLVDMSPQRLPLSLHGILLSFSVPNFLFL
jgi:hypothetical protein